MKKTILLAIILFATLPIQISAANQSTTFTTTVNLTYTNTTLTVSAEGISETTTLTNATQSKNYVVSMVRTVFVPDNNCEQETLEEILEKVESFDRQTYFEAYVGCFGNLTSMSTKLGICEAKTTYESENAACQQSLAQVKGEKESAQNHAADQLNQSRQWQAQYEQQTSRNQELGLVIANLSSQRWQIFLPIGAAAGFGAAYYFYIFRKRVKEPQDEIYRD